MRDKNRVQHAHDAIFYGAVIIIDLLVQKKKKITMGSSVENFMTQFRIFIDECCVVRITLRHTHKAPQ